MKSLTALFSIINNFKRELVKAEGKKGKSQFSCGE